MLSAIKHTWSEVPLETLTPMLSRKFLTGEKAMVAQVFLKKGCVVRAHEHHNEQVTYILEGGLRFWLGENADKAPDAPYVDVMAGEDIDVSIRGLVENGAGSGLARIRQPEIPDDEYATGRRDTGER